MHQPKLNQNKQKPLHDLSSQIDLVLYINFKTEQITQYNRKKIKNKQQKQQQQNTYLYTKFVPSKPKSYPTKARRQTAG